MKILFFIIFFKLSLIIQSAWYWSLSGSSINHYSKIKLFIYAKTDTSELESASIN
jgi:hypothetical protein